MIKDLAISFAMVFVMSFLMLLSFLYSAVIAAAGSYLHSSFPVLDPSWVLGNSVISLLMTALLFALIYRVAGHAHPLG